MREQDIQRAGVKYIESQGGYVVKIITANKAGVPDVVFCLKGVYGAIEFKTPKGVLAPLQEYHLKKIRDAGGIAEVARSLDDVKKILESCLKA